MFRDYFAMFFSGNGLVLIVKNGTFCIKDERTEERSNGLEPVLKHFHIILDKHQRPRNKSDYGWRKFLNKWATFMQFCLEMLPYGILRRILRMKNLTDLFIKDIISDADGALISATKSILTALCSRHQGPDVCLGGWLICLQVYTKRQNIFPWNLVGGWPRKNPFKAAVSIVIILADCS